MFNPLTHLIIACIVVAVKPIPLPSAAPDFFSSQLFGVVVGGVISASVSIIGILIVSRHQQQRDEQANARQKEREQIAYIHTVK